MKKKPDINRRYPLIPKVILTPVSGWTTFFMNVLYSIIVLLCIWGIVKVIGWQDDRRTERIAASNTKTIGTIVKVGSMKGSYAYFTYVVDGKTYKERTGTPSSYMYLGEHYEVIYSKDDPSECVIMFAAPVFLKGELTRETDATIIHVESDLIGFKYNLRTGDGEIKRFQRLPKGKKLNVKKGDSYGIEYREADPRIAYLKF
ncbi:hypothetical protein [Chitinophaga pinensis]|uniref:DUF3592 domain-containing protein n=1 Tax=Chitinophaga pinensis (strain ATCC 43595 / DSM 2588 / LMG 13176 / NBRC 15968 / NCIMB 11800 / UQM 2034) TaxID=485918 RepID=A0A979GNX6_CHIPD|nr:hypothetical protein [Chitinophaga pinensis]ACU58863.1 hypothetical protein Cpin_1366 [Chitinophaga pinensis DSM 2588]